MIRGLTLSLAASLLLAAVAPAQAAETLTLRAAVRQAVATSGGTAAAQARLEGAKARQEEARGAFLPSVSLGVMPIHLGLLDPGLSQMLNGLAPGFSPNLVSETVTVSQLLYDGGRVALGSEAAEKGARMAEAGSMTARQQAAFDAANSYLSMLRAQRLAQAAEQAETQARTHLSDAQLREKTGAGSRYDSLQAETALAAARSRTIAARNGVRLSRLALETALHQPLGNRQLEALPTLPTVNADAAAIERGLAARPELVAAQTQGELDRLQVSLAEHERYPTAAVQGILGQQGLGPTRFYVLMGSLNWSVFDGGKLEAKIKQAESTEKADAANRQTLADGLRLEAARAVAERDEARERMQAGEQGLRTAQSGYSLAQLRYSEGAGSATEVVDAASALSGSEATYIGATYDALLAELKLARSLGLDLEALLGA